MSSTVPEPSSVSGKSLAIDVSNLKFYYPNQSSMVLDIEQWQVKTGDKIFLSGRSGSGKSTLLNLIAGMLSPTSGILNVLGQPLHKLKGSQRDALRARHIGVVFQQFNLINYLTVEQNLDAAIWLSGKQTKDKAKIVSLFESLQLPLDCLGSRASALSVGQQQRVAIARALIHDPQLIIVDEPTSALDSDARDHFMQLFMQSCKDKTVLFVSHDKSLASYFDQHVALTDINISAMGDATSC